MKIVLILCSFILASANARASQAEDYADAVSSAIFSSLYFNEQSGLKELSKLQSQPAITLSEGEMSALSSKVLENNFPYDPFSIVTSNYEVVIGTRSLFMSNTFCIPV